MSGNEKPVRALTTLKWPYIPDADNTYVDPLTRNDPQRLRTPHYEAMATSPRLREILANSRLRTLLARLDALNDRDREDALQILIGATEPGPRDAPFEEEDVKLFTEFDVKLFTEFARVVEEQISETDKRAHRERLGLAWEDA